MAVKALKVGDKVKWMCPLDHDYTYGKILAINKNIVTIKGLGLYKYITADVHKRYIVKLTGGRKRGGGKGNH